MTRARAMVQAPNIEGGSTLSWWRRSTAQEALTIVLPCMDVEHEVEQDWLEGDQYVLIVVLPLVRSMATMEIMELRLGHRGQLGCDWGP